MKMDSALIQFLLTFSFNVKATQEYPITELMEERKRSATV